MTVNEFTLTAEGVAVQLGVTARRVRQISAGELPYLQLGVGGHRRYRERDVTRYLVDRIRGRVAEPEPYDGGPTVRRITAERTP